MTVKKMVLLASMALIALSLTALPTLTGATADSELHWFDHQQGKFPETGQKKKVEPKGELSITQAGIKFGPCRYEFTGTIWNEPGGMGEGEIKKVEVPIANCPTSHANCTILQSTVQEFPMTLTLTAASKVLVGKITIQLHLSNGCAGKTGIANLTPSASGSVEGQFLPKTATQPATVVFNNSGGLVMNSMAATLDGTLEFGTELTALPEES